MDRIINKKTRIADILDVDGVKKVLDSFEIAEADYVLSVEEVSKKNKIPSQVLLNNFAKALGIEVDWGSDGREGKFEASSGMKGRLEGVGLVVPILSGKGGVGKTFIATELAKATHRAGLRVGLLDLDIDCPNVHDTLQISGKLVAGKNKKIEPYLLDGLKIVSTGLITDENKSMAFRGPIMTKAAEQLLFDTNWGELDVLFVDMPPGTSDIVLSVVNWLPKMMYLLITTPTNQAFSDFKRVCALFEQMGVKRFAVIENMVGDVFGTSRKTEIMQFCDNYLGEIKLDAEFSRLGSSAYKESVFDEIFERFEKFTSS